MVYQLVGGRQLWRGHGADREYLLMKLYEFHRDHGTPLMQSVREMQQAAHWLPKSSYAQEAEPLQTIAKKKRRGAQSIGDLLVPLLVRLGVPACEQVESESSKARSSL